ncbi:MAG TPA: sialate O-acetylesterase [Chitinophagaceae bacterium]|nr:sialate O-acetylesterase [Chitinophagaceae bacterium]
MFQISMTQVRLPRLIRDSMILQRDVKIKIWGWASPAEKVTVRFNEKNLKATADKDGKWLTYLPPMKAGGPYKMNIDASNHITINDILIGDVWLCSGQSNMVHQMVLHPELYEKDAASANYSDIRQFWIPTFTNLQKPQEDLPTGYWKWANPQDVLQFSVVAYFFGRVLHEKYHVPIGLINSSVGGPPVECWTSEEGLKQFPSVIATIEKNKDTAYINGLMRAAFQRNANRPRPQDKGLMGPVPWYDTTYVPKGWRNINIPGYWEDQGIRNLDGIVWYRREIDVPVSMTNVPAKIRMGRIVDVDLFYVNGKLIGNTTYQYPQRRYQVPIGLLHPGKNLLVIKVTNTAGKGGFVPDKPYYLSANSDTIDLKGDWQYKVGNVFPPQQGFGGDAISVENQPTALYNAMIAPLTNYAIRGVLWYQGEGNTGRPSEYQERLTAMIHDWRNKWQQGDFPFLYVQLPNFGDMQYLPSESGWAMLRDQQRKILSVSNTAMAVAIDLGDWNELHPDRKKEIGERLALAAMKLSYGEKNIVYSGPLYQTAKIDGNKIIIDFSSVGSGLITNDGEEPAEFAIAGADKKFIWAKAKIEGDHVVVWNENISDPMYVRYAWADCPVNPNLYNKEGLPASPFRTDK